MASFCRASLVALGLLATWAMSGSAEAQQAQLYCQNSGGVFTAVSPTNPCPVSATVSVSASISGFAPATSATPLAVTSTTGQEALPAGVTVQVSNTGSNTAFVNLGTSSSVTATTSNLPIPGGSTVWLTVGSNTNIAAITSSSTTTLNLIGGSGLGTGMGGGGSGGGGSLSATASAAPTSVSAGNANLNVSLHSELFSALSFGGTPLALGAATSANSIPVVMASNQAAFPVTLPTGQQAMAASTSVAVASNQSAIPVTVTALGSVTGGTAGTTSILGGGQFNSTPPTLTNGQQAALQFDLNGNLLVNINTPLTVGVTSLPVGTALSAASTPVVLPTDQAPIPVKQPDVPNTGSMNTNGVTGVPYALTLGGGVQSVEWKVTGLTGSGATITPKASTDSGSTYGVTLAAIPEPTGATFTTFTTDQSFCTNVAAKGAAELLVTTPGSSGTMNIVATASVSSCPITGVPQLGGTITPVAGTTGGATPSTILSAASNNSTSIKASPGTLYSVTWINTTTTLMDIRFYDTASAPTCSSATAMKMNFVVQSNATSPGGSPVFGPAGIVFANGIGVCITGGNTNSDNSNAVTGLNVNLGYK